MDSRKMKHMVDQDAGREGSVNRASDWPAISVITVFYNPGPLLEPTIRSVLEQDYPNTNYVLVDGGSTDGSRDVIKRYQDHLTYWNNIYDKGIYNAMNHGIRLADGAWLNFLNCGDVFRSESVVSDVADQIRKFPEADFIYGKFRLVNTEASIQTVRGRRVGRRDLYFKTAICHQTAFIKKILFEQIGLYDESMKITADYDWFIRYFSRENIHPVFINRVLVDYLLDGASFRNRTVALRERLKIVKKHYSLAVYILNLLLYVRNWIKVKIAHRFYENRLFKFYRKIKYGNKSS